MVVRFYFYVFYVAVLLLLGHGTFTVWRQRVEISHYKLSRDKFEKMYEETLQSRNDCMKQEEHYKNKILFVTESSKKLEGDLKIEKQLKENLQTQKIDLETKMGEQKHILKKLEVDLKAGEAEIFQLRKTLKEVITAKDELGAKISSQNDKVTVLSKKNDDLEEEVIKLKGQIEEKAKENSEINDKYGSQLANLKIRLAKAVEYKATLRSKISGNKSSRVVGDFPSGTGHTETYNPIHLKSRRSEVKTLRGDA